MTKPVPGFFHVLLGLCLLAGVAIAVPPAPWEADELIGRKAPDFSLPDMNGKMVNLRDLRGKVVVVNFWASWCPPCRTEIPPMNALQSSLGKDGLVIVSISSDSSADVVRSFLKSNPTQFTVLHDPENKIGLAYKVYSLPTSYIVGRDGVLLKRIFGAYEWTAPESMAMFRSLLNL